MKFCNNCKYWNISNKENFGNKKNVGTCTLATSEDGVALHPKSLAVAYDGETYVANLLTDPNFSCIQWEQV